MYLQKLFFILVFVRVLKVSDENSWIRIRIQIQIRIRPLVRGMDPRIRIGIHTKSCHGSGTLMITDLDTRGLSILVNPDPQ
jgi:hypothetical protein